MPSGSFIPRWIKDLRDWAGIADGTFLKRSGTAVIGTALAKADVGLSNVDNTADASKAFAASQITSGTVATARLGSGTANSGTFLRGDQTYAAPAGGATIASTSAVLKGDGAGNGLAATAGTDYVTPTGSETLTNKTIAKASNTLTGVAASGANADITGLSAITGTITSAQGTISANTPAIAVTQTWNNGAVSFVPLTIAVTDSASTGIASGFLNFTKGGTHQFGVNKSGIVTAATGFGTGTGVGTLSGTYLINGRIYDTASGGTLYLGSSGLSNVVVMDGVTNRVNTAFGLKGYTVATAPSASTAGAGALIYVSNEAGGAAPAFSDGTNWRRHSDRAVIS